MAELVALIALGFGAWLSNMLWVVLEIHATAPANVEMSVPNSIESSQFCRKCVH